MVLLETWCYHQGEERISNTKSYRQVGHPVNGYKIKLSYNQMSFWQLETVQHSLSAVKSEWSFMDCVLVTLNEYYDDSYIFSIFLNLRFLQFISDSVCCNFVIESQPGGSPGSHRSAGRGPWNPSRPYRTSWSRRHRVPDGSRAWVIDCLSFS